MSPVEQPVAVVPAAVPRLAAFGPAIRLDTLNTTVWSGRERRLTGGWAMRMLASFLLAAAVLAAPTSAVVYVADQLHGTMPGQAVPGAGGSNGSQPQLLLAHH